MAQQETEPDSPQIFISYSRTDIDFVRRLAGDLEKAGYRTWWDRSILPGALWHREIEAAIEGSQICLVVLSPDAVESEWVENEYLFALDQRLTVIPLYYRDCRIPLRLHSRQRCDFRGEESERKYKDAFRELINVLPSPPQLQSEQPGTPESLSPSPPEASRDKTNIPSWLIIAGIFVLVVILGWVTYTLIPIVPPPETPTTSLPSPTPPTPTLSAAITDEKGVPMVLVPAGEFEMGY